MSKQTKPKMPMKEWVVKRAREKQDQAKTLREQAKKRIPTEYHEFLIMLEKSEKLTSDEHDCSEAAAKELSMWSSSTGTYVKTLLPYVTVDGRVVMARDEHKKEGKLLNFGKSEVSNTGTFITIQVTSEIYGSACGTAQINNGGSGVDRTNPLENAETSALGRALGFLGYGIVGTGIASADEVIQAQDMQKSQDKRKKQQNEEGENEPVFTFLDAKQHKGNNNKPYFEILLKAMDGTTGTVYAVGAMYDVFDQMDIKPNEKCKVKWIEKNNAYYINMMKVVS